MKRSAWFIFISVLFIVGSVLPGWQTSAAIKIEFAGTETFDPDGVLGEPLGWIIEPGTFTCPGGDYTGDPTQPCPDGSNVHLRGNKRLARLATSDPRMTGWNTVEVNANWDADFTGHMWGTFSIELDNDLGFWEGTFQGKRTREGDQWLLVINGTGHGTGGAVEGMQVKLVDQIETLYPVLGPVIGNVTGRILDPHSK